MSNVMRFNFIRFALLMTASVLPEGRSARADTICAVIPSPGSNAVSAAEVLETQLGGTDGFRLVSRAEIQAVLNEQLLSAALTAEGTQSRLQLGKLVKADLLVFIRESENKNVKGLTFTVAETRRGLRLIMEPVLWVPDEAESICQKFVTWVKRARDMAARPDLKIVAVSPFESKDIARDIEQRRTGYAKIVEQFLMQQPELAVVEMAEAQALGREVAISGQQIARDLPYYVFGSYKTTGQGDTRKIDIALELRHGDELRGTSIRQEIPFSQVGQALQDSPSELLSKLSGVDITVKPPKLEASLLMERADVFVQISEWDQALSLYESVILLEPKHARAHLQIIKGHAVLMDEGSPGGKWNSRAPDYAGRWRHAEIVLDHIEIILFQRLFSTEIPGKRTSDQVLIMDVLNQNEFNIYFRVESEYDRVKDPEGANATFKRLLKRKVDILMRALADEKIRETLQRDGIRRLVYMITNLARDQHFAENQRAELQTMHTLLELLENSSYTELIRSCIIAHAARYNELGAKTFLDAMERSSSPHIQLGVRLARIFTSIKDEASLEKAKADLKSAAAASDIGSNLQEYLKMADARLGELRERDRIKMEKLVPRVMIPRLEQVYFNAKSLPPASQPAKVNDWLTCEDDLEVVATDMGLFRVETSDQLTPLWVFSKRWTGFVFMKCKWDGQYIWGFTNWACPVSVVDPKVGLVAEFDHSNFLEGVGLPYGQLATIEPGHAFFFGFLRPESPTYRNYATLLSIERDANQNIVKHSETFYESRQMEARKDKLPTVREPAWTLRIPNTEGATPQILVGGKWGFPLLVDMKQKTVQELNAWPYAPLVLYHEGWFYIGAGTASFQGQRSALYRTREILGKPERIIDFGDRPFDGGAFGTSCYYSSMVVFENRLHMMASQFEFPGRTPAWMALDLNNFDIHVLVDNFPEDFFPNKRRWSMHASLRVSPRYGLLLLCGEKVFRVTLPPVTDWPRFPAQTTSKPSTATNPD